MWQAADETWPVIQQLAEEEIREWPLEIVMKVTTIRLLAGFCRAFIDCDSYPASAPITAEEWKRMRRAAG